MGQLFMTTSCGKESSVLIDSSVAFEINYFLCEFSRIYAGYDGNARLNDMWTMSLNVSLNQSKIKVR